MSVEPTTPERTRRWTRSYPPLVLLAGAILMAVLILPSALNLPQSNPTTVLEYAPVPPTDKNPPAQNGNLSSLGLGSSNTLTAGAPPPPPPPPPAGGNGIGTTPTNFECVGNPPRQTSDPMAPPCVPYFQGDNFGSTYQGVTRDTINVVAYYDAGGYGTTNDNEGSPPPGTWVDDDAPSLPACSNTPQTYNDPKTCDFTETRMIKAFSHYFNTRYQTYHRHVHYYSYFTSASTAAGRRGDAVAIWEKVHPFAVLDEAIFFGFNQDFESAMAQLSVMIIGSTEGNLPNSFYRKNAPFAWGFWPDVEHAAKDYSTYVCQKVAPYNIKHFGNPQGVGAPNGQKRRFGMFYPDDPAHPELLQFSNLVKSEIQSQCGVNPLMAAYTHEGYAVDANDSSTDAESAVARFRGTSGTTVTTVLYIGTENRFSGAADAAKYYPEIVVAGNLNNDGNFIGSVENQNVWRNAWAMTYQIRINRLVDSPGYRAFKEGNPNGDNSAGTSARDSYRDHFLLFEAIEVAGPRLTPQSIDQGFHAIPERSSNDPYEAAFFFDPGDYTSVKDATEEWWDPSGRPEGASQPGCWRMINQGIRNLPGHWSGGDEAFANTSDPCTGYGGAISVQP